VHPSNATLLALLHGEVAGARAAELQLHLNKCSECVAATDALRVADTEIDNLLGILDHPAPRRAPPRAAAQGRQLRRAAFAASLALFLAGAAAAAVPGTPLNRWIRNRLERPAGSDVRPGPAPSAPPAPAPAPVQTAGGVEVPVSRGLTIVFEHPEPGGILTVATSGRSDASLLAYGGAVSYQVGDGRIMVANRLPARRYALDIPAGLPRLTILVGGRIVFDTPGGAAGTAAPDTISLSADSAR
jgi:hypothetical protein